jgi:hypothetical protein
MCRNGPLGPDRKDRLILDRHTIHLSFCPLWNVARAISVVDISINFPWSFPHAGSVQYPLQDITCVAIAGDV